MLITNQTTIRPGQEHYDNKTLMAREIQISYISNNYSVKVIRHGVSLLLHAEYSFIPEYLPVSMEEVATLQ